jgi:hypothetical protein
MIDQTRFLAEMRAGIHKAFDAMAREHPDVVIYTISVWTDPDAQRSAVSFDTFDNSEAKCRAANTVRQQLRDRFVSEGNTRRASLVPAHMKRNDNPADFAFQKIVVIENTSLADAGSLDNRGWEVLSSLLQQIKCWAARECRMLNLHPDAQLGISGRKTWYGSAVRIPQV